ncbi:hypothetical protein CW304_05735 [Bacillus sp. UFRGS-B20]|nr:hypothetical protein CW304_05735 [Bacillus sp. UFRGS-B20]
MSPYNSEDRECRKYSIAKCTIERKVVIHIIPPNIQMPKYKADQWINNQPPNKCSYGITINAEYDGQLWYNNNQPNMIQSWIKQSNPEYEMPNLWITHQCPTIMQLWINNPMPNIDAISG